MRGKPLCDDTSPVPFIVQQRGMNVSQVLDTGERGIGLGHFPKGGVSEHLQWPPQRLCPKGHVAH